MEETKRVINQIAYTKDLSKLPLHKRSLIPFLSFVSSIYRLAHLFRCNFYHYGLLRKSKLPVPVISVGNLTWGGNGKTPMVEFIASWLASSGLSPLILTRGYAGGDEARMLQRHLRGTSARIGIGANRAVTAGSFIEKYGYNSFSCDMFSNNHEVNQKIGVDNNSSKIGAAILDDGLQVPDPDIEDIASTIQEVKYGLPVFFSGMVPSHFFNIRHPSIIITLEVVNNTTILCVSAIGSANSFIEGIRKMGPCRVDRFDFSDHRSFQPQDIEMIRMRLKELEDKFDARPIVVVTEKDYDRDFETLKQLHPFEVLVLCSQLQILPRMRSSEESFKNLLIQLLREKQQGVN